MCQRNPGIPTGIPTALAREHQKTYAYIGADTLSESMEMIVPSTLYTRRSILAGAGTCLVPSAGFARRAIPDDNLFIPVLITITSKTGMTGFGSGFYLNTNNWSYLVTASHVLFPPPNPALQPFDPGEISLMSYSCALSSGNREYLNASFSRLIELKLIIRSSDNSDIAMIKVGKVISGIPDPSNPTSTQTGTSTQPFALNFMDGFTATSTGTTPLRLYAVQKANTKAYKDVLVGNDALMYGYPNSLASNMFGAQLDPLQPLLRRGLIAGVNEQRRTIIVDAPAYRGNSGGPVMEIEQEGFDLHFKAIGVVSEFVPLVEGGEDIGIRFNSGYSVVTPLDGILAFIE